MFGNKAETTPRTNGVSVGYESSRELEPTSKKTPVLTSVRRLVQVNVKRVAHVPFLRSVKQYTWRMLWMDFLAGIIVGCVHIPQSMGAGMAANLGPMYGIYLTFFPGIAYALLGSSLHNSIGAFAPSAALVGVASARIRVIFDGRYLPNQTVEIVPETDFPGISRQHLEIAVTITFMAGIVQVAMALFRLEFLSRIFSHNVLDPFNCACSLQIMLVQIPNMLGVNLDQYYGLNKHIGMLVLLFSNITRIRWLDTILAVISASVIIGFRDFIQPQLFKKLKVIIPIEFLLVVIFIAVAYGLNLHGFYGVRILGNMAVGIPSPVVPELVKYMPYSFLDGLLSALVSIAFCIQATKPTARKHGYRVSTKQELVAVGTANVFSSFFSCFVSSANIGRITISDGMGARTQVATLFGSLLTGLLLAFASQTLYYLPSSVIGTIIVLMLSMSLKLFADIPDIWKACKLDAVQWLLTFTACVLLDLEWGLLIGLGFSWIRMQHQADDPHLIALPKATADGRTSFLLAVGRRDDEVYGDASVRVLRIGQRLDYVNADKFARRVVLAVDISKEVARTMANSLQRSPGAEFANRTTSTSADTFTPLKQPSSSLSRSMKKHRGETTKVLDEGGATRISHVIIDMTALCNIDSSGFRALIYLLAELSKRETKLWLVSCSDSVRQLITSNLQTFPASQFASSAPEALKQMNQTPLSVLDHHEHPEIPASNKEKRGSNSSQFWEVTGMPESERLDVELQPSNEDNNPTDVNDQLDIDKWDDEETEADIRAMIGFTEVSTDKAKLRRDPMDVAAALELRPSLWTPGSVVTTGQTQLRHSKDLHIDIGQADTVDETIRFRAVS